MDGLRVVAPGSRLRVLSTIDANEITGKLTRIDDGGLTIATYGGLRTIPSSSIDRVDRSLGQHLVSHTIYGAVLGTLAGAVIGMVVGGQKDQAHREAIYRRNPPGYTIDDDYPTHALEGVMLGAPLGFFAGAIVGNLTGRERWQTVFTGRSGGERPR